jgi:hypothetical protein
MDLHSKKKKWLLRRKSTNLLPRTMNSNKEVAETARENEDSDKQCDEKKALNSEK